VQGDIAPRTQGYGTQTGTHDRRAGFVPDKTYQALPFFELILFVAKTWDVPNPAAFKPHEQSRHPVIRLLAYSASGDCNRTVDLPISLQLLEEHGQEFRDSLQADFTLHGENRRDACFSQARSERCKRIADSRRSAFAGGQHDQPRAFLQFGHTSDQLCTRGAGYFALVVLQPQPGFIINQRPVANDVEDVEFTPSKLGG
jgi:hypothetical protein